MDQNRVTGATTSAAGQVRSAAGQLTGDRSLEAEGHADQATGRLENAYGQARDALRDAADQASDVAGQAYETGRHYLREGERAISGQFGRGSLTTLLVAGGIGFALAWLVYGRYGDTLRHSLHLDDHSDARRYPDERNVYAGGSGR